MSLVWPDAAADSMPIILTNRGLVFPTPGGASAFDLRCNESYGALTSARPDIMLDDQNAVVVATTQDVQRTSDQSCTFTSATGLPTGAQAATLDLALGGFAQDPSRPGRAIMSTQVYKEAAQIYVSNDYARTWTTLFTNPMYSTYRYVEIGPDGQHMLGAGQRYDTVGRKLISIYGYSSNGGTSWTDADTDSDRQPLGFLPNDSTVSFMREALPNSTLMPRDYLLRSTDGGKTFSKIGTDWPSLSAFAATPDGSKVWVGSRFGGLFQSNDSGKTFTQIQTDMINGADCLYYRQNVLWACANIKPNQDGLFISKDLGASFQQKMVFEEVQTQADCPADHDADSGTYQLCDLPWRDWSYELLNGWNSTDGGAAPPDFNPDAGVIKDAGSASDAGAAIKDAASDASTAATKKDSGCALGGNADGGLFMLAMAALLRRRRR